MKNEMRAVKITAGQYRIGKLVVVRRDPDRPGTTTTWCRSDSQGGGILGYSLREVVALANKPCSYAYKLTHA